MATYGDFYGFGIEDSLPGEAFYGFDIEFRENFQVRVLDGSSNPLENIFVVVQNNGEVYVSITDVNGLNEAIFVDINVDDLVQIFIASTLFNYTKTTNEYEILDITAPSESFVWSPILSAFRFKQPNQDTFLEDSLLSEDLTDLDYLQGSGYCMLIQKNETRQFQYHGKGSTSEVRIKDCSGTLIDTVTPSIVQSGLTKKVIAGGTRDYDIYQAVYTFSSTGCFKVEIDVDGQFIESEPIKVLEDIDGSTVLCEFQNYENTDEHFWSSGYTVRIRVEAQLWKRLPGSTRTLFSDSNNDSIVLAQRNQRGMRMETFNIPHYLHEMLAYGFSLSNCIVDGEWTVSPSGYEEPEYRPRNLLSNSGINLISRTGMKQQITDTVVLQAPANLTAEATSSTTIELNWLPFAAATYEVWRGTSSGSLSFYDTAAAFDTYTDTGVTFNTTYYYQVRATLSGLNSGFSNEASATGWELGNCIELDGVDDYFDVPTLAAAAVPFDGSIEIWAKPESANSKLAGIWSSKRVNNTQKLFLINWSTSGSDWTARMFIFDDTGGTSQNRTFTISGEEIPAFSTPATHIVLTWEDTGGANVSFKLYWNGVENSGQQFTFAKTNMPSDFEAFTLGQDRSSAARYDAGKDAQFRYWNGKTLSASEITDLYNSGNGKAWQDVVPNDTPVIDLAFEAIVNTDEIEDLSGNGNNAVADAAILDPNAVIVPF